MVRRVELVSSAFEFAATLLTAAEHRVAWKQLRWSQIACVTVDQHRFGSEKELTSKTFRSAVAGFLGFRLCRG
jgi:hypothetical protein